MVYGVAGRDGDRAALGDSRSAVTHDSGEASKPHDAAPELCRDIRASDDASHHLSTWQIEELIRQERHGDEVAFDLLARQAAHAGDVRHLVGRHPLKDLPDEGHALAGGFGFVPQHVVIRQGVDEKSERPQCLPRMNEAAARRSGMALVRTPADTVLALDAQPRQRASQRSLSALSIICEFSSTFFCKIGPMSSASVGTPKS